MSVEYKPIPGFENAYHISKDMAIKTFPRKIVNRGIERTLPRIKPKIKPYNNSLYIWLTDDNGVTTRHNLNKIIAQLFYGFVKRKNKVRPMKPKIEKRKTDKPGGRFEIEKFLDGEKVDEFTSLAAAARSVDGSYIMISDCCNGIRPHYKGFKWKFKK